MPLEKKSITVSNMYYLKALQREQNKQIDYFEFIYLVENNQKFATPNTNAIEMPAC